MCVCLPSFVSIIVCEILYYYHYAGVTGRCDQTHGQPCDGSVHALLPPVFLGNAINSQSSRVIHISDAELPHL